MSPRKLTNRERLYLFEEVCALPSQQFNKLVFSLCLPKGILPSPFAPQGERVSLLLEWVESSSGCGLEEFQDMLGEIVVSAEKERAGKFFGFIIQGAFESASSEDLKILEKSVLEFVDYLKSEVGEKSVTLRHYGKGSIKIVLEGTESGIAKLQELFKSGALNQFFSGTSVKRVYSVESGTIDFRKAQLVKVLQLREEAISSCLALTRDVYLANARNLAYEIASSLAQDKNILENLYAYQAKVLQVNHALVRGRERGKDRTHRLYLSNSSALERTRLFDNAWPVISDIVDGLVHDLINILAALFPKIKSEYSVIAHDVASALFKVRDIAYDLDLEIEVSSSELGMEGLSSSLFNWLNSVSIEPARVLDLRGSNLSNLVLKWLDLKDFDTTHAIVNNSVFDESLVQSETEKRDLQKRGAIFQELPAPNSANLLPASGLLEMNIKREALLPIVNS